MNNVGSDLKKKQPAGTVRWQPSLILFARLSPWIVAPVIGGVFFGRWLDTKYNSDPWLFLICVGVSFIVSLAGLVKNTVAEFKKITADGGRKKLNEF